MMSNKPIVTKGFQLVVYTKRQNEQNLLVKYMDHNSHLRFQDNLSRIANHHNKLGSQTYLRFKMIQIRPWSTMKSTYQATALKRRFPQVGSSPSASNHLFETDSSAQKFAQDRSSAV